MKEAISSSLSSMKAMADFESAEQALLQLQEGMVFVRDDAPQVRL